MIKHLSIYRHGPQRQGNDETEHHQRLIKIFGNWNVPDDTGCTDLYSGMSIDATEFCINILDQDPSFKFKNTDTIKRIVPAKCFEILDDDMGLRSIVMRHMSQNNWRIKLDYESVEIRSDLFGTVVMRVMLLPQSDQLFNYCPLMLQWFIGRFDIRMEIGKSEHKLLDYYPLGQLYLSPTSLLLARS